MDKQITLTHDELFELWYILRHCDYDDDLLTSLLHKFDSIRLSNATLTVHYD